MDTLLGGDRVNKADEAHSPSVKRFHKQGKMDSRSLQLNPERERYGTYDPNFSPLDLDSYIPSFPLSRSLVKLVCFGSVGNVTCVITWKGQSRHSYVRATVST